jgi:hypothetical protein
MSFTAVLVRIALSLGIAVGIAIVVWIATRAHVFFFPFVLILGAPLAWRALRPPDDDL